MSRFLVIDDEPGILNVISEILKDEGYEVFTAIDGVEGVSILKKEPIDVVFVDVWLPGKGGIDVLKEIKEEWPKIEVIIVSGHATVDIAVKAIKLGAYDYLEKPLDLSRVTVLARNALRVETLEKENASLRAGNFLEDQMIGNTEAVQHIKEMVKQSAPSDSRVMILGKNGTGKELVARMIHANSRRARKPFVEVNCAAIPDNLIESELFGHEKGAFTGALGRRRGKFELADSGTLFLDEVADMSLDAQAKVLRAVQEMSFIRVGGEETIQVDVRVISATNKDIQWEVKEGRFREDLYFRLNVIPLNVPTLRERKGDIPELIEYFGKRFSNASKGTVTPRFSPEAMQLLSEYAWPGNIRELKNFIERVTILVDEEEISLETAQEYLGETAKSESVPDSQNQDYDGMKLGDARDCFEKKLLEQRLEENGYNVSKTAQALGVYPSNLHGKIKKFGIKTKK